MSNWNLIKAIELCKKVEAICPDYGCHVALTGGLLYKEGERKDCDILFYRIRQVGEIDVPGLFQALVDHVGMSYEGGNGWCHKATYEDMNVDCFFPENDGGSYGES